MCSYNTGVVFLRAQKAGRSQKSVVGVGIRSGIGDLIKTFSTLLTELI